MKIKENKKSGFTLAETLITLAIIGVAAAITLPSIIQKYTEIEENSESLEPSEWITLVPDVILQCTGLKDKNGKLIYEGDVVRFYDDTVCIIKWDNESGMFCTLDTEGQAMIGVPKYYEVLGNIYENPELAKEIKETRKNKEEKNNG